jgi:phosphoserine phosphatase RsbU/P
MRLFRKTSLRRFMRELSLGQLTPIAVAIFSLFAVLGPVTDIFNGGRQNVWLLVASTLFSGFLALGYGFGTMRGNPWLLGTALAAHFAWTVAARGVFGRLAQNPPDAAPARLAVDGGIVLALTMISYSCFLWFINGTAARYLRVRAEMDLAHDIHQVLVPAIDARAGGFEFFGYSHPSGEVGGDLVDVVTPADRAGWFGYVADVSGHGVSSGVVMGMFKSALRMRLLQPGTLASLLADLNTVLFPLKSGSMFVTAAFVRGLDSGVLDFAVAGHLPILCLRDRAGQVQEFTTPQIPIGMFESYAFTSSTLTCERGDLLALITDGLTEVVDAADREFGIDAVKRLLCESATLPLPDIADRLLAASRAHGAQFDDQTLLLIRMN